MAQSKLNDLLKSFSIPEKETWLATASREIEGKDPMNALQWKTLDGLQGFPYYDHKNLPAREEYYQIRPSADPFLGARAWTNMPRVTVRKQIDSNPIIINHLLNGGDGVLLELKHAKGLSFDAMLKNVEPEFCSIALKLDSKQDQLSSNYIEYIAKRKISKGALTGFFLWDSIPKDAVKIFNQVKFFTGFKCFVLHSSAKTPIDEIIDLLNQSATLIDALTNKKVSANEAIRSIGFSVGTTTHSFEDIAKLRALRYLWKVFASAYDVKGDAFIHVYSDAWLAEPFKPHGNMLKSTTAALAGICGGCNALTVLPENEDDPMMNRIARNVSNILRDESHLSKVADPLAGSYFIEALTHQIAQAAWTKFQNNQR